MANDENELVMKIFGKLIFFGILTNLLAVYTCLEGVGTTSDHFVYSIYNAIDLGNPGESIKKDYYISMGSDNGVKKGTLIEVNRKNATFDLLAEKLYRDILFPIAHLKVIHVEKHAAVARLQKLLDSNETPTTTPFAVMVGDTVRILK